MKICWTVVVLAGVLLSTALAKRAGGGGGRRTSGGFGSIFGRNRQSSSSSRSGSSYPKQQYGPAFGSSNVGGGGGGFVAPKNNPSFGQGSSGGNRGGIGGGGFVAPKNPNPVHGGINGFSGGQRPGGFGGSQTFSNSFGRHGGGTDLFGRSRSSSLFGGGGKKAFALGTGAGFLGGAVAGVAAMEVYHRYRQFSNMMAYKNNGVYGGDYYHGHGVPGYGREGVCIAKCPIGAFCDFNMCRCRPGYEARYGSCWNSADSFRQRSWANRMSTTFNPFITCEGHQECINIDMNMICSTQNNTCECTKDMKWNEDLLECQLFMDVDCSNLEKSSTSTIVETTSSSSELSTSTDASFTDTTTSSTSAEALPTSVTTTEQQPVEIKEYDLTSLNISTLTPNDTLANSALVTMDVKKASGQDIKRAFCREVAAIALKYQEPETMDHHHPIITRGAARTVLSAGMVALIVIMVLLCCGSFAICICWRKMKNKFPGSKSRRSADSINMDDNNQGNTSQQFPPANMAQPPLGYGQQQQGYPELAAYPGDPGGPGYPPVQHPQYPPPYMPGPEVSAPYPPAAEAPPVPYPPSAGTTASPMPPYPPAGYHPQA